MSKSTRQTPIHASLYLILSHRRSVLNRNIDSWLTSEDIDDLHDIRVNARRLHAALRMFGDILPGKAHKQESRLKALLKEAGTTRECDVFLQVISAQKSGETGPDLRAVQFLEARVATKRARAVRNLRTTLRTRAYDRGLERFIESLKTPPRKKRKRSRRTLRDEAQRRIPRALDRFLRETLIVVGHPRRVVQLHEMRLRGKSVRYLMEFCAPAFKTAFDDCVKELREALIVFGSIHDCDMHIPEAKAALEEIRTYNSLAAKGSARIPQGSLKDLISSERRRRQTLFHRLCDILLGWQENRFVDRVREAMGLVVVPTDVRRPTREILQPPPEKPPAEVEGQNGTGNGRVAGILEKLS